MSLIAAMRNDNTGKVSPLQRWVCGGNAALCQIILDTCFHCHNFLSAPSMES